jgi:hypothetical protein
MNIFADYYKAEKKFEVDESEKFNDDYVETEIKISGSKEASLDAATIFGDEDAVAQ